MFSIKIPTFPSFPPFAMLPQGLQTLLRRIMMCSARVFIDPGCRPPKIRARSR